MTITHDTHDMKIGLEFPAKSPFATMSLVTIATFRRLQYWHRIAVQKQITQKLSEHLRRDIGEVDHLAGSTSTFLQSAPSTYQDRLQQMWLR